MARPPKDNPKNKVIGFRVTSEEYSQSREKFDLKRYVQITEVGLEYLKLRDEHMRALSPADQ